MPNQFVGLQVPISNPIPQGINAGDIIGQSAKEMPTSQADFSSRGGFGNTIWDAYNDVVQDKNIENTKRRYAEISAKGKENATIAYRGTPELFGGDKTVLSWIPDPSIGWENPETGTFDFDKWSQHYYTGLQKYSEFESRKGLEQYKQESMNARQKEALEQKRKASEASLAIYRWATALKNKEITLDALKQQESVIARAASDVQSRLDLAKYYPDSLAPGEEFDLRETLVEANKLLVNIKKARSKETGGAVPAPDMAQQPSSTKTPNAFDFKKWRKENMGK